MKIDAHHHLWKYGPDYGWISNSMSVLKRDFLPRDLKAEIDLAGIGGVVAVQARQTLEETRWLLELASQNEFIKGVVGWAPLAGPNLSAVLAEFAGHPKLKGLRHVIQDEPDERYILGNAFNRGISALEGTGLVYDILIFERHLRHAIAFVDRHPRQVFVLDHIAKPRIREGVLSPWCENLRELARRPNVYCKLSGVVTEADFASWTEDTLRPYLEAALEVFGPRRLMFGSDWPVCLLAAGYQRWVKVVANATAGLSPGEKDRFWGGTAAEVYQLSV